MIKRTLLKAIYLQINAPFLNDFAEVCMRYNTTADMKQPIIKHC